MSFYAEVRNSDNVVLRNFEAEAGLVPPPQKFGPLKFSRIVPVNQAAFPNSDLNVFNITQATAVTPTGVDVTWTQTRKPLAEIIDNIEEECLRRINGMRGVLFYARYPSIVGPTAPQTARFNRIVSIIAFSETLKASAGSITNIAAAAWPA